MEAPAGPARRGASSTSATHADLLSLAPLHAVVRLALPTTAVMLVAALSNVLYTWYVSRLGPDAIAAVSLVFPLSLVAITAMNSGIGGGSASAIARALGAGDEDAADSAAEHGLALSVVVGLAFAALMLAAARTVFDWMGGSGPVLDLAVPFARIVFGGATVTFLSGMLDAILRGEGNVRIPAIWSTTSLLLQMATTPLLVFGAGLGLPGAAFATIASQALTTLPRALHVLGGRGLVRPRPWPRHPSRATLREILRVGIPASLSTTINYVGIMALTGVVARLGTSGLAGYGLGTRLDFLLLSVVFGVASAVLTLVGLATGAGRQDRVVEYVRAASTLIAAVLAAPAALLWWRPSLWTGLFTTDPGIRAVGEGYFSLVGPSYPFVGVSMVLAFAFQGLGRATAPLAVMATRMPAVLAVAIACTRWLGLGERAVFAAIAAGNVIAAVVLGVAFLRLQGTLATTADAGDGRDGPIDPPRAGLA